MSKYNYNKPVSNEEHIRTEASSKSVKKYNRQLADAFGVSVPKGSPSEAREELLEIARVFSLNP